MGGGSDSVQSASGPPGGGGYPTLAPHPVGQQISSIYLQRISQFTDAGQWEKRNLLAMMYEGIAKGDDHVKLSSWSAPDQTRPTFDEALSHDFTGAHVGDVFGPAWSTHWFRVELRIPDELRKKRRLEFHWDANNEGMVWSSDGKPLQGLTGSNERIEWILPDSFRDGHEHVFYVEMACNGMFGCSPNGSDSIAPPDPAKTFQLLKAQIVAVNMQARALFFDMWIIRDAARELPPDSWQQHRALAVATRIIDTFRLGDSESLDKCRAIARELLGAEVDDPAGKMYGGAAAAGGREDKHAPPILGIGHCHIDSCWLWPWAETKRKVARSWTNQCNLMEIYPELRFACSQAQQYKWLEQGYPHVFGRVRDKVREGKFCPIGGSWVEHDTNMPSGESLARQFLYGQRYFESRFGARCRTFWLPDTFGYAAQLPQMCRLAGMSRFVTQKLSWNNINQFPHTTFNWVALDGSQVICHMPPSETYTAEANLGDVRRSISKHKSMDHDHTSLLIFGKGDGGGGPTWQQLEKLRRCRGLAGEVAGAVPQVQLGGTVDEFFDRLEPKAAAFATWYGELYFELHRGTYTTQANNKKNNRRAESLLRDVELLATIASIEQDGYRYPKKEIDEMWEAVLLCQFHDCLPGSSIEMCYDDSDQMYAMVFDTGKKILTEICSVFGASLDMPGRISEARAVNTLPWHREELVDLGGGEVGIASGSGQLLQIRPYRAADDRPAVTVSEVGPGVFVLENGQLRVRVENGLITSLFDTTAGREVIESGGRANQYVIFDDKPLYWQAWDVEVYHLDTRRPLESGTTKVVENKGHIASLVTETRISGSSWIKTTIRLSAALEGQQSYVECEAEVEWRETMKFLKVEFPVEVRNTEASYETAFGLVRRPTHYNTSWDMAKFEVCCHRFADLSEHNYGVSVLNDSKYGFATCGTLMRLSLLRSPKAPDATADMGRHTIRWAILPHAGPLGPATVRAGFQFNSGLKMVSVSGPAGPDDDGQKSRLLSSLESSPVTLVGDPSLVLDTVKRGEDDEDVGQAGPATRKGKGRSVVLRIYDSLGCRSRAVVRTRWEVERVFKTNILEDEGQQVDVADGAFGVALRPFEVATYRLELGGRA